MVDLKNKSAAKINSIDSEGRKINIHPADVKGRYRTWRNITQVLLMLVFLITPWTTINGIQTVLIDIENREFYFLGSLFRSHNAPLLVFIGVGAALTLAFVTTVWGRLWCGWACPQTVFIDGVYRRIEEFVEGNYLKRIKMKDEPLSVTWIAKKAIKWFLFFVASSVIAHSFLAYFLGAYKFHHIIADGPQVHRTAFLLAQGLTLLFLFDFGWFREQFCTIACPYGRIQGVLLDKNSLAVVYDEERNDCVKCNRCVAACPVGIDIRNGLQMECIACTACVDACDEIMRKVKKPEGLIRYDTLDRQPIGLFKVRSILYMIGIVVCFAGLVYAVSTKQHTEAFFMRAKEAPFQKLDTPEGAVLLNHYRIHLTNQDKIDHEYSLEISPKDFSLTTAQTSITLIPKEFREWHLFVKKPLAQFKKGDKVTITIKDTKASEFTKTFEAEFFGPVQ